MSKFRAVVIIVMSLTVGFIGGAYYGFRTGIYNLGLLEEIVQGALSRHQLIAMDKGNIDFVKFHFELNIDSGLHRYIEYKDSGNKLLSKHFLHDLTNNLDRYVDVMVDYRRYNPIVFNSKWALPSKEDDKNTALWREQRFRDSEKMLTEIKQFLRAKGVPETALTSQTTRTQ
jgi:hypothetical protein